MPSPNDMGAREVQRREWLTAQRDEDWAALVEAREYGNDELLVRAGYEAGWNDARRRFAGFEALLPGETG